MDVWVGNMSSDCMPEVPLAEVGHEGRREQREMLKRGMPGGLTKPVSQNTQFPKVTPNQFTMHQFKIVLGFPSMLVNCSRQH